MSRMRYKNQGLPNRNIERRDIPISCLSGTRLKEDPLKVKPFPIPPKILFLPKKKRKKKKKATDLGEPF